MEMVANKGRELGRYLNIKLGIEECEEKKRKGKRKTVK